MGCGKDSIVVRTIKTTETLWGLSLKLFRVPNLQDSRLDGHVRVDPDKEEPTYIENLDYSKNREAVPDEEAWRKAIRGQPLGWTQSWAAQMGLARAKLMHDSLDVKAEGLHGALELVINHRNHALVKEGAEAASLGPKHVFTRAGGETRDGPFKAPCS
jgi:hypothetical protein